MKVFVYGSLKKGFHNHRYYLANSEFISTSQISGFQMGKFCNTFPFIIKGNEDDVVFGEIYEIDERTLNSLDRLESCPNFYERITTKGVKGEELFVYILSDNYFNTLTYWDKIPSGVWK